MKPIIGVTPDYNAGDREDMGGKHPTYFLRARYLKAIEEAGGIPIILPLIDKPLVWKQILAQVDGLLFTGSGSDLSPGLYGEKQRYTFKRMSGERATLELGLAKLAYKNDVPTLGICGGMQSINVALGGTLFQDIDSQLKTSIPHQPTYAATKTAHSIQIEPRSLLHRIAGILPKSPRSDAGSFANMAKGSHEHVQSNFDFAGNEGVRPQIFQRPPEVGLG